MTGIPQAAIDAASYAVKARHEQISGTVISYDEPEFRADVTAALQAAVPHITEAYRELLAEANAALWACAKAFLTVEPTLKTPYPDDPRWSPWTRWAERPARQAHDLHVKLRRYLKTPVREDLGDDEIEP